MRNSYTIDKSQELVFLGVENIVNSEQHNVSPNAASTNVIIGLFGAMTTGAAMSRTAVNSECGVKSPVNFLFTAAWIVLTLYELSPALYVLLPLLEVTCLTFPRYWIPKATLSAIIVSSVACLARD